MNEQETVFDLTNLFHAHTKVKAAKAACEASSARLELEQIRERMYELRSQHEPLASLCGPNSVARQKIIDSIFYVVVGRWPNKS